MKYCLQIYFSDCRFDEDNENFFTFTIRILIVHYILNRQTLDGEDPVGLEKLISDNVYIAAYPLHDVGALI